MKPATLHTFLPCCGASWSSWRKLWAVILSTTYSALFLFAVICIATGIFHPEVHSHHKEPHHHHSDDTNAPHPAGILDLCDFARLVLMTTAWGVEQLPLAALFKGNPVKPPAGLSVSAEPRITSGIRAPPTSLS